jgi:predicted dinucleotide-binding enzyme
MDIAILGTGGVGQTIGSRLVELGHKVRMGSRTADNPKAAEWVKKSGANASQGTFADAAAFGEILFNCTSGAASLPALESAGAANLAGKVLVDVANPLDFSKGMPPTLSICNDDSLGERIQKAFPALKVVKSLNTTTAALMVNPGQLAGGDHTIFMSGNDAGAKEKVRGILASFGWKHILDLGDITTARGTEMVLPLWLRLWGTLQTPIFNYKIVR